jgi:hypothetical protein
MSLMARHFALRHYWLTTAEASKAMGVTPTRVGQIARERRMRTQRVSLRASDGPRVVRRIAACCVDASVSGHRCLCGTLVVFQHEA